MAIMQGSNGALARTHRWPSHLAAIEGEPTFPSSSNPVDLEIGSGTGWFAVQHCTQHPHRTLVCLERSALRFEKLLRRTQSQAPNALAIRADATHWVSRHVPKGGLDQIFLWYPNPFPKKQRWVRTPFFGRLLQGLKDGGRITLATNIEEYAREATHLLRSRWGLVSKLVPLSQDQSPRTHFERKYLQRGQTCWEVQALKISAARFE